MSTATLERPAGLDDAAFTDLYTREHDPLVRYMRRHVPDTEAADLADETFTRAWAGRHTFRASAGDPTGWLYGIAGRVVADHYRTAGRRVQTVGYWPDQDDADNTDVATQTVTDAAVAEMLAALPERQRLVVARRILDDQPIAAVAAELGCAEGTVKSLASRALAVLRTLLVPVTPVEPQPVAVAVVEPTAAVSPALVARHLNPLPLPALARQHIPSLDQPRSPHVATPTRPRRAHGRRHGTGRGRPTCRMPVLQPAIRRPDRTVSVDKGLVTRHPTHRPNVPGCGRDAAAAEAVGRRLEPPEPGATRRRRHRAAAAESVVSPTGMWTSILTGAAFLTLAVVIWLWVNQDPHRNDHRNTRQACDALRDRNEQRLREIGRLYFVIHAPVDGDPPAVGSVAPVQPGIDLEHTVRMAPEPPPARPVVNGGHYRAAHRWPL